MLEHVYRQCTYRTIWCMRARIAVNWRFLNLVRWTPGLTVQAVHIQFVHDVSTAAAYVMTLSHVQSFKVLETFSVTVILLTIWHYSLPVAKVDIVVYVHMKLKTC